MNLIKYISPFLLALSLVFGGCSSTPKTPQRIAYNVTDNVLTGADKAIEAWSDYVVRERKRIAELRKTDPGAALDANTALLNKEGKVSAAYYKYQDAAKAALLAGATASSTQAGQSSLSDTVAESAGILISVINSFLR